MFADDTNIFYSHKPRLHKHLKLAFSTRRTNEELIKLNKWFQAKKAFC